MWKASAIDAGTKRAKKVPTMETAGCLWKSVMKFLILLENDHVAYCKLTYLVFFYNYAILSNIKSH